MHISVIQFLVSLLMELLWCHFDLALDDLKGTFEQLDAKPGGNPPTKSYPENWYLLDSFQIELKPKNSMSFNTHFSNLQKFEVDDLYF